VPRALVLVTLALVVLGVLFFALRPDDTGSEPQERSFEISIEGDAMEPSEIAVREGDNVTLRFSSERLVELHVHGYDLEEEVAPGEPTALSFEADETGRFGIEDHETGEEVGTLVVEPR
jgi:FtsP/CotA-like multicopper oxidase with cupredoxin domain